MAPLAQPADAPRDRSKTLARLAGSATAGAVELFGFHPIDTVAKRLMNNPTKITTSEQLSKVIFKSAHDSTPFRKYTSLFPGLTFAAGYKILQRVYKFGGQPLVNDLMNKHHVAAHMRSLVGDRHAKPLTHALAGSLIGVGEIVLLPLDVLKIKAQNNPEALRGRSFLQILSEERLSTLFRGAGWTAARNAPGSFALFGGAAVVKEKVFHLQNYSDATFVQNFVASVAGGIASIAVSSPLDVIKTRVQAKDFGSEVRGSQILAEMLRNEGFSAFFKGLVPKILVVGPKLIFSFTIAQTMIAKFEVMFANKAAAASQ